MTQWAVVTGAGKGLGAVIARQAVKAGYRLAAWDIDEQSLASLATEFGDECLRAVVDVSDEATVEAAVAALPEPPALLVNNAGVVRFGPLLSLSAQDWRRAVDVNLTGTFLVGRAIAARMIEAGGGAIVNIASINGIAAAPNAGAYTASKAAVIKLTEHMALEWGPMGVRVNAVAPGRSTRACRRPSSPIPRCAGCAKAACRSAGSAPPTTSPRRCSSSVPPGPPT